MHNEQGNRGTHKAPLFFLLQRKGMVYNPP